MSKLEIITTEEFKQNYEEFGYEEFVRKVLHKCSDKKAHGLIGKITLIDAEISKRIFFNNEEGQEFTIRYFIQDETKKTWSASYTLYKDVWDEDGTGHGEEISFGCATTHYIFNNLSEEFNKNREEEVM